MPFLIVERYNFGGLPEPGWLYLENCLANCDWTGVRYAPKTAAEKKNALDKLIGSAKWKVSLDDDDRNFLAKQVK